MCWLTMGHFRAEAVCRNVRCGLVPLFRDKRDERSAALSTLPRWDAQAELGPHSFHFERIGGADSRGNGALRNDKDGADRDNPRDRRVGGWNWGDGEQHSCWTDRVGRRGRFCRSDGEAGRQIEGRVRERVLRACAAIIAPEALCYGG